jgi:hypothetical protein
MKTIIISRHNINGAKSIALKIANVIDGIEKIGINMNTVVIEFNTLEHLYELARSITGLQMIGAIDNTPVIICYMNNEQWSNIESDEKWILI